MRNNLPFKVLAILLALTVWFLAKQEEKPVQVSFFAPIIFTDLPPMLQVAVNPTQVNVSATVSQRRSSSLNPAEIRMILDLGTARPGTYTFPVEADNLQTPVPLDVEKISPNQVELVIEELIEKELPLQARYSGQLGPGYLLEQIEIVPPTARVRGPKRLLDRLSQLMTREIDLSDLNSSTDMLVKIDLPSQEFQIVNQGIDSYRASITLGVLPVKKRFDNVPIYFRNSAYVSLINPSTFNLFLEGPPEVVNFLNNSDVYGTLDLLEYSPGSYQVTPKPFVPKQVSVLQQWPIISLWVKSTLLSDAEKLANERLLEELTTPYSYPPEP
jgi:YbbR domain-containing protein